MPLPILAIAAPSFCRNPDLRGLLQESLPHWQLNFWSGPHEAKRQELIAFLQPATAAIIGKERVDASLLANLPRLRAIAKYGVGLDNIDLAACQRAGVRLFHQKGVNATAVAELALAMMLGLCRKLCEGDRLLRSGVWRKDGGRQLSGSQVAIIGCGATGSSLARLLPPFACRLLLCDIEDKTDLAESLGAQQVSFAEAMAQADFISLHVPLTAATRHMINATSLQLCRPGAYLINTSRGAVVDLGALQAALASGQLGGAGLDVFPNEPHVDPGLLDFANCIVTPHIAGNAKEAVLAMGKAAIAGILEFSLLEI